MPWKPASGYCRPVIFPTAGALIYSLSTEYLVEQAMNPTTLNGSCLCGSVKYEVTGEAQRFFHCHCSRCRKATGTGHASNLFLQPAALKWRSGEELVRTFKVPEAQRFTNNFCSTCGSRLPRQAKESDLVMIPAGSLDSAAPILPQARIFSESRTSWSCTDENLPAYPEFPPN
jgi:hypothetical protein